jgi:transposase InsO family protein
LATTFANKYQLSRVRGRQAAEILIADVLAAVVDLFSRRVVGWSMSAAMAAPLVTDALMMAIWRMGEPVINSHSFSERRN